MKVWWLSRSPVAAAFAARLLLEKTIWTWDRGPQMVGFTLMHVYPVLAVAGIISWMALMAWMLPAIYFLGSRMKRADIAECAMLLVAALIGAAVIVPDNFFV